MFLRKATEMSKFCSNDAINRSLDRAQARREAVDQFVTNKIAEISAQNIAKFGDSAGTHAYMTGYLQSLLGNVAQCESVAEMRRVLRYSGIEV